jgi:basic membrane lipoprotein Med (substrate-binding protein (PBP1-ABC) superfamily)
MAGPGKVDPAQAVDAIALRSWSLHVLGPLEVRCADAGVDLGPPKQRAQLAILILNADEIVSTDRLVSLLWGDWPPRTAVHSVHIYVSELRKLLATLVQPPVIATQPPGYRLRVSPDTVDAFRFERLVRSGTEAIRRGQAAAHPQTRYVTIDDGPVAANVATIHFDVEQASYLAGAAAALTSEAGSIGFLGGVDYATIWPFEAGYEAGARAVDPNIQVLTTYLSAPPKFSEGFQNPDAGEAAARELYNSGADVIFSAAGSSGLGVFQVAVEMSVSQDAQLWAIGVDADQYETVGQLLGSVGAKEWQQHILTSVVNRFDDAAFTILAAEADGRFEAGVHHLGLRDGGVDLSYSGGFLDSIRAQLESLRTGIIAEEIRVPCRPQRLVRPTDTANTCEP